MQASTEAILNPGSCFEQSADSDRCGVVIYDNTIKNAAWQAEMRNFVHAVVKRELVGIFDPLLTSPAKSNTHLGLLARIIHNFGESVDNKIIAVHGMMAAAVQNAVNVSKCLHFLFASCR